MATITSILLTPTSYFPLSHLLHVTLHLHVPLQSTYYSFATKNWFSLLLLLKESIFSVLCQNSVSQGLLGCKWLSAEKPVKCSVNSSLLKIVKPVKAQINSKQFCCRKVWSCASWKFSATDKYEVYLVEKGLSWILWKYKWRHEVNICSGKAK